jgi:hypothetical protein
MPTPAPVPVPPAPPRKPLYLYLDEGGDLTFSKKGTRFFTLTTFVSLGLPRWAEALVDLKAEVVASGVALPFFHASEDRQAVRDKVFQLLVSNSVRFVIDALIVEKSKTGPALQEHVQFYSRMIGYLLRYRMKDLNPAVVERVVVITDGLPANKKRKRAIEKAIKEELSKVHFWGSITYEVIHDTSKNHFGLQLADYCNWAIFRKWERNDIRSYDLIKPRIRSEFDIFRKGVRHYY